MKFKSVILLVLVLCMSTCAFADTDPADSSGFVLLSEAVPDAILVNASELMMK